MSDEFLLNKIRALEKQLEQFQKMELPGYSAGTYTIVWAGGATPPVIGNGTLEAHSIRIGNHVTLSIFLLWGSTTSGGNGAWTFSLPFAASAVKGSAVGVAWVLDSGTRIYNGSAMIYNGGTTLAVYDLTTNMDASHPHTWAVNDVLRITVSYECE